MDVRTKRIAQAICLRERGPVTNATRCKTCRDAEFRYDPETNEDVPVDQPDGCLGLGYEHLAHAAEEA